MPKIKYTEENIKAGFEKFREQNGRYPNVFEIDDFEDLPTARTLQRRFGGARGIRAKFGLDISDFRTGETRRAVFDKFWKRSLDAEDKIHKLLVKRFGEVFVHREYFFADDKRTRTDFYVYCQNGNFLVDVFFPSNIKSLARCLSSKQRTYGNSVLQKYPIIFLQMNDDIDGEDIKKILTNKKIMLSDKQLVMSFIEFNAYIKSKRPQKLNGRADVS
jgi:hypothetical protein